LPRKSNRSIEMATSNKVPVSELLIKIQTTERQADGSLVLSVSYMVQQELQRAKISIPGGKGMTKHLAYRVAVDLFHKRMEKGTECLVSGTLVNSVYRLSRKTGTSSKDIMGLSTRLVLTSFEVQDNEDLDGDFLSIPMAKEVVQTLIKNAGGALEASRALYQPSEPSESDEEPLTRRPRKKARDDIAIDD
ncbi:hypothetical protein BGX28_009843, partial [Mortierella sp. GBA30]